jgi:hypothetical protein
MSAATKEKIGDAKRTWWAERKRRWPRQREGAKESVEYLELQCTTRDSPIHQTGLPTLPGTYFRARRFGLDLSIMSALCR